MKIEHSTVARCGPQDVWKVFTDTVRWRECSSLIGNVQWVSGVPWQPGSRILLELIQPAYKLEFTVKECQPHGRVVFTGVAMGVSLVASFDFAAQADGSTLIKSATELSGAAVFFINNDMKNKGMQTFSSWVDALKSQAETLATSA